MSLALEQSLHAALGFHRKLQHAAFALTQHLHHHPGRFHQRPRCQRLVRTSERLPALPPVRRRATRLQKQKLDAPAARSALAEYPRAPHPRVVQHQQRALRYQLAELRHPAVRSPFAFQHQHARPVALLRRPLRNRLHRQRIVEQLRLHVARYLSKIPPPPSPFSSASPLNSSWRTLSSALGGRTIGGGRRRPRSGPPAPRSPR